MIRAYTFFMLLTLLVFCAGSVSTHSTDARFVMFATDPSEIKLYWKDDKGQRIGSIQNLKTVAESKQQELVFAMNGGMYTKDHSPQGLYIEKGITHASLDTSAGSGNFYLKPNGVFYLTKEYKAVVCQTQQLTGKGQIEYATQSGPMLVMDGQIHPAFKKGSANVNIRNGVGILPGNKVVFAMSKQEINLYDFAEFFQGIGCTNALYLDGFVSRTYLPQENWKQLDGNFGVLIGVTR